MAATTQTKLDVRVIAEKLGISLQKWLRTEVEQTKNDPRERVTG